MAYQGGLIVLFVLPLPQDSTLGFSQFTDSFVFMCVRPKKRERERERSLSSPVSILHFLLPHTRRALAYPHRFFFFLSLSLSSLDINTAYVTAGCAPNAPSVLISPQNVNLLFYCNGNHVSNILTYYIHSNHTVKL